MLATARPTTIITIRTAIDRWHEVRDCLRAVERMMELNAYLDAGTKQGFGTSLEFEAELAQLINRLDAEGTRLTVESCALYVRTHAKHRPPLGIPEPVTKFHAPIRRRPRGARPTAAELLAAIDRHHGNAIAVAKEFECSVVLLYKWAHEFRLKLNLGRRWTPRAHTA